MGNKYHSAFDISYEELYAELKRVKSENYYLKRQLKRDRKTNKNQSKLIDLMNHKIRRLEKHKRSRKSEIVQDDSQEAFE